MFLLIMKAIFWKWMLWFAHEFLMVFEAFDQWPLILREGKSKVKNVSLSLFCTATLTSNHLAIKLTIVRTCIVLCKVCSLYTTFMYISPKQQCPHFLVDMVWILIGKIESNPDSQPTVYRVAQRNVKGIAANGEIVYKLYKKFANFWH